VNRRTRTSNPLFRTVLKSAVGKWQRRLHRLFELAGVEKGHAHRFRDTFAVELLLKGTPIVGKDWQFAERPASLLEFCRNALDDLDSFVKQNLSVSP
jgi:integrase